jgi:hypothetical protein
MEQKHLGYSQNRRRQTFLPAVNRVTAAKHMVLETLTHSRKSNAELTRLMLQKAPGVKFEDVVPPLLKEDLIEYSDGEFYVSVAGILQRKLDQQRKYA